jgi:hypothetical protein
MGFRKGQTMIQVRCERADCGGEQMRLADRSGVEVDYCPVCKGVWLDRGELEKIIARSQSDEAASDGAPDRRGKRSFFSELFDF